MQVEQFSSVSRAPVQLVRALSPPPAKNAEKNQPEPHTQLKGDSARCVPSEISPVNKLVLFEHATHGTDPPAAPHTDHPSVRKSATHGPPPAPRRRRHTRGGGARGRARRPHYGGRPHRGHSSRGAHARCVHSSSSPVFCFLAFHLAAISRILRLGAFFSSSGKM